MRYVSFVKFKEMNSNRFVMRMWTTDYPLCHENSVSSCECTQTYFYDVFTTREYCKGQAFAPGNVTVAFTERFATDPRFVTSNWRRRHSECTCGTMNSDPPTMTTTTTTTTIMPTKSWEEGAFRGGGRMGPHSRSKEREGVVPSCWYFS